jgi:uncharacterized membrane protein YfhO
MFTVTTERSSLLYLRMFYWPGWRLLLDGQGVPAGRSADGRVAVSVPAGLHEVEIEYAGTRAQTWGEIISLVTLISLLASSLYSRVKAKPASEPSH